MKPNFAGITGWLLALMGLIVGLSTTSPLNGATLAGCLLIAAGGYLVGRQVSHD